MNSLEPHADYKRARVFASLQFGIGWLFLVSFVAFAVWGRFPVPYRDDWDWLYGNLTRPLTVSALLEPHNEHLIPLPRLLFAMQYWLDGTAFRLSFALALTTQLIVGWVFWRQVRERWRNGSGIRRFVWGLTAVCLFATYQLQSIVFAAAILFPLVQLFVVLACAAAATASADTAVDAPAVQPKRTRYWTAALAAVLGAALTTTNGLVAPAIVALFGLTSRRCTPRWVLMALVLFQVLCAVAYIVFGRAWGAVPPLDRWSVVPASALAEFFLSFFVSGLLYGGTGVGVAAGSALFAAGAWCLLVSAKDGARRPAIERFASGLILFTMISAAMTTIGRAQLGVVQAAQSRYATYTLVYWSALMVWILSRMDLAGRTRTILKMMPVAVAVTACSVLVQLFVGLVWIAKKQNLTLAALTLATGVDDEEWMATLHPQTQAVHRTRALLVADGAWRLGDPRIGVAHALATAEQCEGNVRLVAAHGSPGWRLDGVLHIHADTALIGDRAGIAVGVAERAPIVAIVNPSPMDVVRAVWIEVTGRSRASERWIGLSRIGAGPPYTVFALDDRGRAACAAPASP